MRVRSILFVSLVVGAVSMAASCKGKPDCNQACNHLLDLAREDIKTQPIADYIKSNLIDQADKSRPADLETCMSKCAKGDWNGSCLLDAKTFVAAKECK